MLLILIWTNQPKRVEQLDLHFVFNFIIPHVIDTQPVQDKIGRETFNGREIGSNLLYGHFRKKKGFSNTLNPQQTLKISHM